MCGILKNNQGDLLEIGGMPDHVHLLVELKHLDKFSHVIRDIKASSSMWVHKNYPQFKDFSWQEGYGSFSVSFSALDSVKQYIHNQVKHHATISFEEEYCKFLKCHKIQYDPRFVFG
jgi:REP element-mobilizing transposase RayT